MSGSSQLPNGHDAAASSPEEAEIVEINVGGHIYNTSLHTLKSDPNSLLGVIFAGKSPLPLLKDSRGRFFIDRDGTLFRYILDFLRSKRMVLPENFTEKERLLAEAEYFRMPAMADQLRKQSHPASHLVKRFSELNAGNHHIKDLKSAAEAVKSETGGPGYITLGYRGTFAFGRDGLADVQFRKILRLLVSGKVNLCREVFKDTLNESRDPDRGHAERYSARFFLKHNFLEQAFDALSAAGFVLTASCASGVNGPPTNTEQDTEESRWLHYNEFIFFRA